MIIDRFMRMILFFDLPTFTKTNKRDYVKFVKYIKEKGFCMMQESVYTKLALNETVVFYTMKEIKEHLPKDGMISVLTVTEKQFSSIENILGEFKTDVIINEDRIVRL